MKRIHVLLDAFFPTLFPTGTYRHFFRRSHKKFTDVFVDLLWIAGPTAPPTDLVPPGMLCRLVTKLLRRRAYLIANPSMRSTVRPCFMRNEISICLQYSLFSDERIDAHSLGHGSMIFDGAQAFPFITLICPISCIDQKDQEKRSIPVSLVLFSNDLWSVNIFYTVLIRDSSITLPNQWSLAPSGDI